MWHESALKGDAEAGSFVPACLRGTTSSGGRALKNVNTVDAILDAIDVVACVAFTEVG